MNKKWIAYGVSGVVGIGLIAGGATAAAATLDLRTGDGEVVPGGALAGKGSILDQPTLQLRVNGDKASVVTAPSPTQVSGASAATAASPASAASAPSPVSAATPPAAPSPVSAATPPAPASAPSAPSLATPPSPASAPSAASAGSVASAPSN